MKKCVSLIIVILMLSGCANMNEQGQGAGLGALLGAAVGAGVGAIAGGKEGALTGAIVGAGAGAIGGYLYGDHVANKKKQYAKDEDYLNACIASARQVNSQTRQYNASLKNQISYLNSEVNKMVAMYNSRKIRKADLQKEKNKVLAKHTEAQKTLQRAKDEVAIQREVMNREKGKSQAELAQLNNEVRSLEKSVAELEQQTETLASMNRRIPI
ncbi:MAG: hypothetical protein V2I97_06570 [Desulfococcaceae bacterium]|nr:hypothetical protein [Desulfococcaceae bacterium]